MSQGEKKEDPWVIGSQYAQMIGAAPSSFSTLIRGLLQDSVKNDNKISFHHQQAMVRFLKGESMKAPFYFAIKTFKPEVLTGKPVPLKEIVHSFKPYELASYLGFLYTYRRVRSLVKNESEWDYLREVIVPRSEVACFLGYAIENIGPGLGLIAGGVRFMGWVPFVMHDEKGYIEYRRHLKKSQLVYDLDYEMERWGCTHSHIAAHLLIGMGFNKEAAMEIGQGLLKQELPAERDGKTQYAVKLIEVWTDSIIKTGQQPDMTHSGNFYPVAEKLEYLLSNTASTLATSSQHFWMEKQKADVNESNAPEIFGSSRSSASA